MANADGVFEGGGVKGIALVGALTVAEEHGYDHAGGDYTSFRTRSLEACQNACQRERSTWSRAAVTRSARSCCAIPACRALRLPVRRQSAGT